MLRLMISDSRPRKLLPDGPRRKIIAWRLTIQARRWLMWVSKHQKLRERGNWNLHFKKFDPPHFRLGWVHLGWSSHRMWGARDLQLPPRLSPFSTFLLRPLVTHEEGGTGTYVDWIQYLYSRFASIDPVEHLVDFSVRPFADGLDYFPGVCGVWKVVKDNGFPWLWKHLQERSPAGDKHTGHC